MQGMQLRTNQVTSVPNATATREASSETRAVTTHESSYATATTEYQAITQPLCMNELTMDEITATTTAETHESTAAMNEMLPIINSATLQGFFSVALYQSIMSE